MKQGALDGLLKELGYTEEQVSASMSGVCVLAEMLAVGLQILDIECT